jgi:hypothetical protein
MRDEMTSITMSIAYGKKVFISPFVEGRIHNKAILVDFVFATDNTSCDGSTREFNVVFKELLNRDN